MEHLFQQLIDQMIRTNDLLEKQQQTIRTQQLTLKIQQEHLAQLDRRMAVIEDLQQKMGEILDRELLSVLDKPLLTKPDIMAKLGIADSTYREHVRNNKLQPMTLGKIDYYFARDLAKALLKLRRSGKV